MVEVRNMTQNYLLSSNLGLNRCACVVIIWNCFDFLCQILKFWLNANKNLLNPASSSIWFSPYDHKNMDKSKFFGEQTLYSSFLNGSNGLLWSYQIRMCNGVGEHRLLMSMYTHNIPQTNIAQIVCDTVDNEKGS